MADNFKYLLNAVTAATTGTPVGTLQKSSTNGVIITTTGGTVSVTVTIKVGNDKDTMATVATFTITTATSTAYEINHKWPFVSADTSSHTNGTVTVTMSD